MEELVVEYNQLFKYIKETFYGVYTKMLKELKVFIMKFKVNLMQQKVEYIEEHLNNFNKFKEYHIDSDAKDNFINCINRLLNWKINKNIENINDVEELMHFFKSALYFIESSILMILNKYIS